MATPEQHLKTAEVITWMLESRFTFFKHKFGIDPLIGMIPWLGDVLTLLMSLYLFWIATQLQLPGDKLRRMLRNIALDFLIGVIPIVGTFGDFFFKSNTRNLAILKEHLSIREAVVVD